MKKTDAEREEARTQLLKWLKPGDTVYTVLRHVSRSGMQREIGVVLLTATEYTDALQLVRQEPDGSSKEQILDALMLAQQNGRLGTQQVLDAHPNYSVSKLLGYRMGKRDGLIVGGCGMDMGFEVVYNLSAALFGKGYACLGKGRCPSNYHVNYRRESPCGCVKWDEAADESRPQTDCLICQGTGKIRHTPEQFNLVHTDGYALKHRWL